VPASAVGVRYKWTSLREPPKGSAPGQQVVLYARGNNIWWVQPFRKQPFTRIQPDGTWKNSTHLGTDYAALLVEPGYVPQAKISELPKAGSGVVAVVAMKGTPALSASLKTIHFSGYDWDVRAARATGVGCKLIRSSQRLDRRSRLSTSQNGGARRPLDMRGDRVNRSLGLVFTGLS